MHPGPDPHARHDTYLVASLAAADLDGAERDAATALVAACTECRRLHDDLIAIAGATAALPAAARTRDFTISPQQAARLRPSGWRGLIAAFAAPRMAFTRSLGVGLTTLGLAGLLFSALPSGILSMGAAAGASAAPEVMSATEDSANGQGLVPAGGDESGRPTGYYDTGASSQVTASGAPLLPMASEPARASATDGEAAAAPEVAATKRDVQAEPDGGFRLNGESVADQGPSLFVLGSIAFVVGGLALLVARRLASRIAAG